MSGAASKETAANTIATPRTRGLSLRAKWTAALLSVAVVPLVVIAPIVTAQQRKGLLASEQATQVSVMDHAGSILEGKMRHNAAIVGEITSLLAESRITDEDAKLALLRRTFLRSEEIDSVIIYGADGALLDTLVRDGARALPAPQTLSDQARQAPAEGTWLEPEVHPQHGLLLRFVMPVISNGSRTGFALGQLRSDTAPTILAALSRDHLEGRDDGLVLFYRDLRVLASSRGATDSEFRPGASMQGKELLQNVAMPVNRFDVMFVDSGVYRRSDGSEWVASVRTLPTLRMAVLARRPSETVLSSLAAVRRSVLIALAGIAVVAVLAGAWIASRTTRPIRTLIDLARDYAQRKFATRSTVRTADELEELGASMESMADNLSASEKEIARRATVEKDLSRFLPAKVAAEIAGGSRKLELGGERRKVSVLFADVVSFTPFAEKAEPEKVVEFLNELFTVMTEVVFRHDGTVDKFIGDAIMAFFGAPNAMDDHAERAVACAEDMHRFVEASAPEWKEKYGIDVRIAVGVNSGEVIVGNLGSESRMDYTAIGDVVNVAARLEALARPGQTLVTGDAAKAAGESFEFHPLGEHPLRGKEQSVAILELVR
ncbi:MAG: adenylate/guanylate cyclase domain-containing protein [Polyangiales bacterium]